MMESQLKRRVWLVAALLLVIPLGLGSRKFGGSLPVFFSDHAGDALWTVAVYLSVAILFPRMASWKVGMMAVGISFAVEFSQLIDVPWLNTLRGTLFGKLLLGAGFLWIDLLRYFVGAVMATLVDRGLRSSRSNAE